MFFSTGSRFSVVITPLHHGLRLQHRLLVTRLLHTAVNVLLISIIAFPFNAVSEETDHLVGVLDPVQPNITTSAPQISDNDTTSYYPPPFQDDSSSNDDDNNISKRNYSSIPPHHHKYQEKWQKHQDSFGGIPQRAPAECTQEPTFSILTSESADFSYDWKQAEIWTFGSIFLVLECRASSPIDMNFDGHLIQRLRSVETVRTINDDAHKTSCYSIAITVETNREATGNYSCWSLQEPVLATSLYLFAHGGTPPYLLHALIGNAVIDVESEKHDREIIIPCVVTNPNVSVALYKINFEGFTLLSLGDHLLYDPKRGFIMKLGSNNLEPYGKYKCLAMNSSHFDVIVDVKKPTDTFFHDPIVQGRLEIVQDRFLHQSLLCNTSSQAPSFKTTIDCKTPIDCRFAANCLKKNAYCSANCPCSTSGDACSTTLKSNYAQIGFPIDSGCSTIPANSNGGIVECSAVNFEPFAQVPYFIGLNGRIVQNWKSVSVDELVKLEPSFEMHQDDVFFVGETIKLVCKASRFLFSRGFRWNFQLTNGTNVVANAKSVSSQVPEGDNYIAEIMDVKITLPDIKSVSCYSPIWNETGWVQASLELRIKDSVPPKFLDPENETLVFYVNDDNNSITCEAEAFPEPQIMWFKNGQEYIMNLQRSSLGNFTRAFVFLPELSLFDDQSVFVCNASNPGGTIIKVFTLNVREASIKMTLTLAGTSFILLIGVFALVCWIFYTSGEKKPGQFYAFTDQEVEAFFKGNPDAMKKYRDGVTKAIYHAYDKAFEIDPDDLQIDYQSSLGEGQFGIVLRGKLQTKQGPFPVAVKTTKDSDASQLRSLLSEIKLMTYIGKHENIVNLIGAITQDLKKRLVYVVVEFCQFGSLEEYLKKHRGTFFDEFRSSMANICSARTAPVSYVRLECLVKTSDLIIWAYQITNAMEYLASRKIIHGDLALRNVLLDSNQVVKMTDFGLSKHIYTQTNQYVSKNKKQDTLLPWRWLAPETLKDHVFSMGGDVWSFGVLLYELFTLAELPYVGMNFNDEFLLLLGNGFRLNQPPYANSEIYATMRNCWRLDANERPNFTALKHFFGHYIRMQHPLNQSEIASQYSLKSEIQQQRQQYDRSQSTDFDAESIDKEENTSLATVKPAHSFSTIGSVSTLIINGQRLSN